MCNCIPRLPACFTFPATAHICVPVSKHRVAVNFGIHFVSPKECGLETGLKRTAYNIVTLVQMAPS